MVLISDHGMTDIKSGVGHIIELKDYVNGSLVDVNPSGAVAGILEEPGSSV